MKKCRKRLFLPNITGSRESKRKCKHDKCIYINHRSGQTLLVLDDKYARKDDKYVFNITNYIFYDCGNCNIKICTYCNYHYNYYTYPHLSSRDNTLNDIFHRNMYDYPRYCISCVEGLELIESRLELLDELKY